MHGHRVPDILLYSCKCNITLLPRPLAMHTGRPELTRYVRELHVDVHQVERGALSVARLLVCIVVQYSMAMQLGVDSSLAFTCAPPPTLILSPHASIHKVPYCGSDES